MAKLRWHKAAQRDLIRKHGYEIVNAEYNQKVRQKESGNLKEINLGIHEAHNWKPIKGPFGPHEAKIICITCNNKFICWLPKGSI